MCEATVSALTGLMDFGLVSSASVMTPCPWFGAAAAWFRDHPEVDVGVHITLNSEWERYRWRPVSTVDETSGLVDGDGFLPRTREEVARARVEAVVAEARAQVEMARRSGLRLSHMDAHMFTFRHLFPAEYARVAEEFGLTALVKPFFDQIVCTPNSGPPEDRVEVLQAMFAELPPGLSCVLLHPACDTPELRAIVPQWRYRVADQEAFQDARLKEYVERLGIRIISYRELAERPRRTAAKN